MSGRAYTFVVTVENRVGGDTPTMLEYAEARIREMLDACGWAPDADTIADNVDADEVQVVDPQPEPPAMTRPLAAIAEAAEAVAALDPQVWADMGQHLTCSEVEALAALFDAIGIGTAALMEAHARGDEPGDDHWRGE